MNNTFEAVARKWHADQAAKPDKWKPDHAGRVIRSLELHIFPNLARRQIGEIMPLEVLGLLQRLEAAGKHDTAHKVYDVVNQVFRYAVMLRLCIFNPAAELRGELAQVEQKHYRTITDPEKIGGLLRALQRPHYGATAGRVSNRLHHGAGREPIRPNRAARALFAGVGG